MFFWQNGFWDQKKTALHEGWLGGQQSLWVGDTRFSPRLSAWWGCSILEWSWWGAERLCRKEWGLGANGGESEQAIDILSGCLSKKLLYPPLPSTRILLHLYKYLHVYTIFLLYYYSEFFTIWPALIRDHQKIFFKHQ